MLYPSLTADVGLQLCVIAKIKFQNWHRLTWFNNGLTKLAILLNGSDIPFNNFEMLHAKGHLSFLIFIVSIPFSFFITSSNYQVTGQFLLSSSLSPLPPSFSIISHLNSCLKNKTIRIQTKPPKVISKESIWRILVLNIFLDISGKQRRWSGRQNV